ncbi:type VII toxin-antitoxin system MntA family adenylyltransferase antitoxin [Oscillatoria acuminata]|uniref:Putative nucleotidyltransferase n=1 Tax=Oscillatoria acuminata PCC 6304 TaxID=56110 RepID=K9TT31_9CYAN|nr:nucleotidyltransferase domain-containing protein [Oscillatoria acuminata]AFY85311.1 putative nucleotidyltransferase [Oscillatoria acuminata PCC 6304]
MNELPLTELSTVAPQLHGKIPELKLLILFGSRARGDFQAQSDWDFAVLSDEKLNENSLKNNFHLTLETSNFLSELLGISSDKLDIVQLNRAGALISHFVARDGKLVYERETGEFERFCHRALLEKSDLQKIHHENLTTVHQFLNRWRA